MTENKYFEELGKPFPASDVSWKIQFTSRDKTKAMVVPYLDARAIADRLDSVVGQYNWKDEYAMWHCYTETSKKPDKNDKHINSQLCTIYIYDDERKEWIGKTDGAENTDIEPVKGGLSDSLKRCAVKWNIGRYLYSFEPVWVNLSEEYGRFVIDKNEYKRLEQIYNDTVIKIFGKGSKPQNENITGQSRQIQNAGNSQNNPKPKGDVYEIKNITCEGEGQTVKSTLILDKNGTSSRIFMYGKDPNLKMGTRLTNLRGKRGNNSYGQYFILESYDIAA